MRPVPLDHRQSAVGPETSTRVGVRSSQESAVRLDPRDRGRDLELRARRTLRLGRLLSPRSHKVHHDDNSDYSRKRRGYHRTNLRADTQDSYNFLDAPHRTGATIYRGMSLCRLNQLAPAR
jgi:hypothetical protein